ncbi:MAG: hypothetical protein ACXAAH_16305, partial [Promethearchaeota archaeon]
MEKDKYYTPTIEEFHVGFEYEYSVSGDEGTWETTSLNGDFYEKEHEVTYLPMRIRNSNTKIHAGRVRVKHLDREDIESFGFEWNEMGPWRDDLERFMFRKEVETHKGKELANILYVPKTNWMLIYL